MKIFHFHHRKIEQEKATKNKNQIPNNLITVGCNYINSKHYKLTDSIDITIFQTATLKRYQ
jgi:hypothetical protein